MWLQVEGTAIPWTTVNGPAIGIDEAVDYELREGFMAPGDTLVLFTDGVTEAAAEDGSLFGVDRLGALLHEGANDDPASLVRRIVDTVASHAPSFHATDDMTVMSVSWRPARVAPRRDGATVHWLIEPEVSLAGIRQTQQVLHAILTARGVDQERIGDTELIAEELLANIIRAAAASETSVHVSVECALAPAEIVLTIRDDGREFDPLVLESTRLDVDIAERGIGGLGIPIVRQLADACRYARVDGANVLEIRLRRTV
jgi:sigma-B regulation protein RsbU (phosphoserine phosphatase)